METAKIFKSGNSQAIRLPKAYRFQGEFVYLKRVGNTLVLIPEDQAWDLLFESLDEFSDDFMEERNQPPQQYRKEMFE